MPIKLKLLIVLALFISGFLYLRNQISSTPEANVLGQQVPSVSLVSPKIEINSLTPAYSWSKVDRAYTYLLYIYSSSEGKAIVDGTRVDLRSCNNSGICSTTPSVKLTNGYTYKWKVRAHRNWWGGGYASSDWVEFKVNTGSTTPTPTPTVPPTSSATTSLIYKADFETGDFYSLTGTTSGYEGSLGAYFGKGVYYKEEVVPSPAIGNYSAALTIGAGNTTCAYLFVYKKPSKALAVYSADYYVPSSLVPSNWWMVWQWKSKNTTYNKPVISLDIVKINGVLQVRVNYVPGGVSSNATQYIYQSHPIAFPTNKWVNITGHYYSAQDNTGYFTIYQDGVKILEKSGFATRPSTDPMLWSVNSYADSISPNPATIYVDNLTISE